MNILKLRKVFADLDLDEDNAIKLDRLINLYEHPNAPTKVVVFGKFNHGKSSFLNAWFEKDQLFAVSDIRETQQIQQQLDEYHNVIWFDTPGLDAELQDDVKAKEALKEADILCLVHSLTDGELDRNEILFLKNHSSLVERGVLLLTKLDQQKESDVVVEAIQKQLEAEGIKLDLFAISSERYKKYIESGKTKVTFKETSLFIEFKEYIERHILSVNEQRSRDRKNFSDDLISILTSKLKENKKCLIELQEKIDDQKIKFETSINKILNQINIGEV